jgi:hypothetical protein
VVSVQGRCRNVGFAGEARTGCGPDALQGAQAGPPPAKPRIRFKRGKAAVETWVLS